MSRAGQKPEIIPEGYDVGRVIADNPQMSAMMARDKITDEVVFLKLRNPERDTNAAARIKNEADILASLNHSRIPGLITAEPEADHPFIVTEFRDSDPTVMKRFRQFGDPVLAAELGSSALSVLEYVHEQKVVHCDVKPNNLLLSWEESVLVDFDISQRIDRSGARGNTQNRSAKKTVIGTLEYMSPEQFVIDMTVDGRSDVYSMGQVLLYFLSGKKPASAADRIKAAEANEPTARPVDHWGRTVPAALLEITYKAMEIMPEDRYQSAGEMAEQLERFLRDSSARHDIELAA